MSEVQIFQVNRESLPVRCDVCHNIDKFDAITNHCARCCKKKCCHDEVKSANDDLIARCKKDSAIQVVEKAFSITFDRKAKIIKDFSEYFKSTFAAAYRKRMMSEFNIDQKALRQISVDARLDLLRRLPYWKVVHLPLFLFFGALSIIFFPIAYVWNFLWLIIYIFIRDRESFCNYVYILFSPILTFLEIFYYFGYKIAIRGLYGLLVDCGYYDREIFEISNLD